VPVSRSACCSTQKLSNSWLFDCVLTGHFSPAWSRSPDTSKVKNKMVYASSKDTFRQQLDGVQIELQATDASELDYSVITERALR